CSLARGLLRGLLHRFLGDFLLRDFLRGHGMALLVSGTCRYYCPVRNTPRVSDPRSTDDALGASHRILFPGHPCPASAGRADAPCVGPSTRKTPLRDAPRVACSGSPGVFAGKTTPESTMSTIRAED